MRIYIEEKRQMRDFLNLEFAMSPLDGEKCFGPDFYNRAIQLVSV